MVPKPIVKSTSEPAQRSGGNKQTPENTSG